MALYEGEGAHNLISLRAPKGHNLVLYTGTNEGLGLGLFIYTGTYLDSQIGTNEEM